MPGTHGMNGCQDLDHDDGIEAHVLIHLTARSELDQAAQRIGAAVPANGADPNGLFCLKHLHVVLGEVDMIADVVCRWTDPRGHETRIIAEWVNAIRDLTSAGGQPVVASTSTAVCIEWP